MDPSSEGYIDKKNDRRMDDCLRYALVSGKKALKHAGLGADTDAFKALNKQRCVSECPTRQPGGQAVWRGGCGPNER